MGGIKKGYKHPKVTKRNRTDDILKLVESDYQSTRYLTKKAKNLGIYKQLTSVQRQLIKLLSEDKVEKKVKEGYGIYWRLKSIHPREPDFDEL